MTLDDILQQLDTLEVFYKVDSYEFTDPLSLEPEEKKAIKQLITKAWEEGEKNGIKKMAIYSKNRLLFLKDVYKKIFNK